MNLTIKENEYIEFKESLSHLDKGLKSLSAMLNRQHYGTVYFGVKDDGAICGLKVGEKTFAHIRQKVSELIFPKIVIDIKKVTQEDKTYLILTAQGSDIPYSCDGRYFIRNISSDEQVPPQLLRKMLESGDADLIKNSESMLQNLSFKQFINYCLSKHLRASDSVNFYKSKSFYNKENKFNLMSFLLSDQNNVSMKIVKFNGLDKTSMSQRTEYGYKCLFNSIDDILTAIKSMNVTKVDLSMGSRVEDKLFDFECFREAFINACLHNHWIEMIPPSVFVFDNRIEVLSYGDLPYGLNIEDFYTGLSLPVNKSLKDIFVSLGLSEQSGHGIPIVVNKYGREAFEFKSGTIKVTIPFAFTPDFVLGRRVREYVIDKLTENQKNVIKEITDNPTITQNQLAVKLNLSLAGVKKILLRLQELDLVERKGSKKQGSWIVKVS